LKQNLPERSFQEFIGLVYRNKNKNRLRKINKKSFKKFLVIRVHSGKLNVVLLASFETSLFIKIKDFLFSEFNKIIKNQALMVNEY
jgi:hypothetical protein